MLERDTMAQKHSRLLKSFREADSYLMPGKKVDFDTVRSMALGLSGVEESTMYGKPAFKVCGKMFACIPVHSSAEPDSLAVCIDSDRRADLMADAPGVYYVTDHYVNHPIVLIRLSRIHADALGDLLGGAWRFVYAKIAGRERTVRRKMDSRSRK
jgi:hypothetical protein